MAVPPLACTVRGCGLPLERQNQVYVCQRRHSYDVARSGYINLLQPQDRKSSRAGDSAAAVSARSRLLSAGVGRSILDGFVRRAAALPIRDNAVIVDLGSGSGEVLGALTELRSATAVGIDLSAAAAEHAARQFPGVTWVVANADRRLPLLAGSVDLVMSLHGRRNPVECARVLTPAGYLLTGLPAHDDLIELREVVLGRAVARERVDAVLSDHERLFAVVERSVAREQRQLERTALLDLLQGTYRGARASAASRLETLHRLQVTLASDVVLLRRRS